MSNKGAENTFDFFASSPLKKSTSQGGQPSTEPLAQIGSKNQTIAIDYLDGLSLNSGINFNTMAVGNNISGSKPNAKNFSSGSGLNFSQSAL